MNETGQEKNSHENLTEASGGEKRVGWIMNFFLPLLILLVAVGIAILLFWTREEPEPEPREERVVIVRTEKVYRSSHRLDVVARGQVRPYRQAAIVPQVTGKIVEVNPRLVLGGLLSRDEILVRIEEKDFRLAVQEASSSLTDAQTQLALEKGRQGVAREEWQKYMERHKDSPAPETVELVLRQPQLQALQANVEAAKAGLDRASLNLERTAVRVPFDAVVLSERAAVGQLANPQQVIADLADSSVFWVLASIPSDQIHYIAIPGINAEKGSRALIQQDLGLTERIWEGRVVGLAGDVVSEGMMARILVAVEDPFERETKEVLADGLPLLLGVSVKLIVEGRHEEDLVEVPRSAIREDDQIFVFSEDGVLSIRRPVIAWRLPHSILVRTGMEDGERVITSPMEAPVEGLRLQEEADR